MPVSFIGSASGAAVSNPVLSVHASTASGDMVIAAVHGGGGTAPVPYIWPAGWTEITTPATEFSSFFARCEWRYRFRQPGDTTYALTAGAVLQGGYRWATATYRGVDTSTPVLQQAATTQTSTGSAITTATVTDSTSGVWRVETFSGTDSGSTDWSWGSYSPADTERQDGVAGTTRESALALADSNGIINASGGTSVSATPSAPIDVLIDWIALLNPSTQIPHRIVAVDDAALSRAHYW